MDIVERLNEMIGKGNYYEPEFEQAKAEIERLREALSAIAASEAVAKLNPNVDEKMMWIGCAQIARSALQQNGSE